MRLFVLLVFVVGLHSTCLGQWKIFTYKGAIATEKYNLENEKFPEKRGYVFFDSQFGDSAKFGARLPLRRQIISVPSLESKKILAWQPRLSKGVECFIDSTHLYVRAYFENVKNYDIYMHSKSTNDWYISSFVVNHDKYQLPLIKKLASWTLVSTNVTDKREMLSASKQNDIIDQIAVVAKKRDASKKMIFALADFKIINTYVKGEPARGLFFYQLSKGQQENFPGNITSKGLGKTFPFALLNSSQELLTSNEFYFVPDSSRIRNYRQHDETLRLIRYILERYPYYSEHRLDKEQVLKACDRILTLDIQFSSKLDSLKYLVESFNDSHFYIESNGGNESKAKTAIPGPLLVKEFFGDVYIAAVLGNRYPMLRPGMKLLEVGKRPILEEIELEMKKYRGSLEVRRSKAISRILYRQVEDSVSVMAVAGNDTVRSIVYYGDRLPMPSNFVPINASFKIVDGCGYIRYNVWQYGNWLALFNNKDSLKKLRSLIIDLRRNPGGENFEVMQAISSFISKPVVFSHELFKWDENATIGGTNVIHPNLYMSLRHLKLFILVDERTACASEAFVEVLREHANAMVIGSSRTSGSFAALQVFHLPGNINIFMNGVTKLVPASQQIVENVGLVPDIYVPLTKVEDLYPYSDKVLTVALHLAKYY